jgi:hypothetical protein
VPGHQDFVTAPVPGLAEGMPTVGGATLARLAAKAGKAAEIHLYG